MKLDVIDNHRCRFSTVPDTWIHRKMGTAVKAYQLQKNKNPNATVLSLTKNGLKVKTNLAFGKSTESYIGHQMVEVGQFVFTPRDFDATPILCGVASHAGCISNLYIVFDVADQIDARFLEYYFWGLKLGFEFFKKLSFGMRYSFNRTQFENIPLMHPDLPTQKRIAAFLDCETARIDALIAKQERTVFTLKEYRAAAITHAVMGGLDKDAPTSPSGVEWIGDIPAHWDAPRIAALFREAFRPGEPTHPVLSVSIHNGVTDGELADEDRARKVALSEDRTKYQGVAPDDLVYNMMRAWQGAFGAVTVHGLVSPAYVVAKPIAEFRTKYIEHLLHTKSAAEEIRRFSRGITDFRMRLYWDYFRNLRVCLPPPAEQDAILAHIEVETAQIDGLVSKTNRSIELLKEKRVALITAAVTGKIDVRNAA